MKKQQMALSRTQREFRQRDPNNPPNPADALPNKREFFKEKRRERIYSLNATVSRLPPEDCIINKFLFGKKEPFVCGLGEKQGASERHRERVLAYLDFLWKANYACGLFVRSQPEEVVYRAYVGPGNNSFMLKALIKRRFWWALADKPEGCNFVWTQLKLSTLFRGQAPACGGREPAGPLGGEIL